MRKGIFGMPPLSEEERKQYIDLPPEPWKQWLLREGLKPWVGLGLFTFDAIFYLTLKESGNALAIDAILPSLAVILYLNFALWIYLWRIPTPDEIRQGRVVRSALRPFAVGRWTLEYPLWKESKFDELSEDTVNPREFS